MIIKMVPENSPQMRHARQHAGHSFSLHPKKNNQQ
jgi:hypothetical protein